MDSLSLVLKKLKLKGQGGEAVVNAHGKLTLNGNTYQQDEVVILRTYRFEGESDPGDAAIIYVVKANDGSTGYCMDGYGIYSSHTNDPHSEFIRNAIVATSHRG